jgi:hypothetical protein
MKRAGDKDNNSNRTSVTSLGSSQDENGREIYDREIYDKAREGDIRARSGVYTDNNREAPFDSEDETNCDDYDYYKDIKDAYLDLKKKKDLDVDFFFKKVVSIIDEFSNENLKQCQSWRGERTAKYFKSFFTGKTKSNTNKVNCQGGKLDLYNQIKHILVWTNNRLLKGRLTLSVSGAASKNYLLNDNLSSKNKFIYLLLYCFTKEDIENNDTKNREYGKNSYKIGSKRTQRRYTPDEKFKNKYNNIFRNATHFINLLRSNLTTKIPNYQDYKDLFVERDESRQLENQKYDTGSFKYQLINPLIRFLNNTKCYQELKVRTNQETNNLIQQMNIESENLFGFEHKEGTFNLIASKKYYTKTCETLFGLIKKFDDITPFIQYAEEEDSKEKLARQSQIRINERQIAERIRDPIRRGSTRRGSSESEGYNQNVQGPLSQQRKGVSFPNKKSGPKVFARHVPISFSGPTLASRANASRFSLPSQSAVFVLDELKEIKGVLSGLSEKIDVGKEELNDKLESISTDLKLCTVKLPEKVIVPTQDLLLKEGTSVPAPGPPVAFAKIVTENPFNNVTQGLRETQINPGLGSSGGYSSKKLRSKRYSKLTRRRR